MRWIPEQIKIVDFLINKRMEAGSYHVPIAFSWDEFSESLPNISKDLLKEILFVMKNELVRNVDPHYKDEKPNEPAIKSFNVSGDSDCQINIEGSTTNKLKEFRNILVREIGKNNFEIDEERGEIKIISELDNNKKPKKIKFSKETSSWELIKLFIDNYGEIVEYKRIHNHLNNDYQNRIRNNQKISDKQKKNIQNAVDNINKRLEREAIISLQIKNSKNKGYYIGSNNQ